MDHTTINLDSTPRAVERAPFASESGLQRFVEENANEILGLRVVGSSRHVGANVLKIDTLGVDRNGRPWIIECKHDLVDSRAITQLHRYRTALLGDWSGVKTRVADTYQLVMSDVDPGLILVGYRYDQGLNTGEIVCLAYRYHDIEFTDDELQTRNPGRVSVHRRGGAGEPGRSHPRVSKKLATSERLEQLPPAVAKAFWDIDSRLQEDRRVKVNYGGKNFVRYRTRRGVFAEAVITPDSIEWWITSRSILQRENQAPDVLELLLRASHAG